MNENVYSTCTDACMYCMYFHSFELQNGPQYFFKGISISSEYPIIIGFAMDTSGIMWLMLLNITSHNSWKKRK